MSDKTDLIEQEYEDEILGMLCDLTDNCSPGNYGYTLKIIELSKKHFVEQALEAINAIKEGPQPLVGNYHNGISKAVARQAIKDKFK